MDTQLHMANPNSDWLPSIHCHDLDVGKQAVVYRVLREAQACQHRHAHHECPDLGSAAATVLCSC